MILGISKNLNIVSIAAQFINDAAIFDTSHDVISYQKKPTRFLGFFCFKAALFDQVIL
jgi:hypothetical protein